MASGETLAVFTALDNVPPSSNYATIDSRNSHIVLDFDAGTDEAAYLQGLMPANYDGGGLTVTIVWMSTGAVIGDVVWGTAWERHDDEGTDLDGDSFAAAQTGTGTCAATNGAVQYTSITHTNAQIDSLAASESFRLKVYRDANAGADTMVGDAELLRVEVRET